MKYKHCYQWLKQRLWLVLALLLYSCGLPDDVDIPPAPKSIYDYNSTDNEVAFRTPSDTSLTKKIDRYVIWYKIYPYIDRTNTLTLVKADYDHFEGLNIRAADDIGKRDFHELQFSSNEDDGYYFFGIKEDVKVTIERQPTDTTNYLRLIVEGGKTYNVRRNVATSVTNDTRKPFYGQFSLKSDKDIKDRKNSDFASYDVGGLQTRFAVAFMAQSAYLYDLELTIIKSSLAFLGVIYSNEGFEDN